MRAIILDGSKVNDTTGERVLNALLKVLQANDCEADHIIIRDQKIGNCAGNFSCWIHSPGMCRVDDDNRRIAEAVMASDLMVYLTPVTFGGYSSILKRMVDHQIQNILPYFTKIDGETHHKNRYEKNPDFLVVGWMDTPDTHSETVFKYLAKRNAINLYNKRTVCGVVHANHSDDEIFVSMQNWLTDLNNGHMLKQVRLPEGGDKHSSNEMKQALLLIGSPRTRKSTSNSLGEYLFERLAAKSIQTKTVYLHTVVRSAEKMNALFETINAADLVTLAFPLYVDSLPSPVIDALEQIAANRQSQGETHRPLFMAITNCGFPEAVHNTTALAMCEIFARQANFNWAGSLALGGGEMVHGKPLPDVGGQTMRIRKSLESVAEALTQGQAIPKAAQELMAKPVIPHWLYRFLGELGLKRAAKSYGVGKLIKRQPYLVKKQ